MSVTAIAWAWKQPVSRNLLPELLALADNTNDVGVCWVRVATLAAKTKTTERTVQRNLIALRDAGLLTVIERRLKGSGNRCNLYLLPLPGIDPKAQQAFVGEMTTGTLAKTKQATDDTSVTQGGRVTPVTPRGDTSDTRIHKNEPTLKGITPAQEQPKPAQKKPAATKGDGKTLLPEDWTVPEKTRAKLLADGYKAEQIEAETEYFKIYWSERRDSVGRKASWSMAFLNWMKRAGKEKAGPGEGPTNSHYKPNRGNYGSPGRKQSSASIFGQLAERQQANQRRDEEPEPGDFIEAEYTTH